MDIIAFQRADLLNSRDDYVLTFAKMLEADTFRSFETIKDYASVISEAPGAGSSD